MTVYYEDATVTVHSGDCLDVLRGMPDASIDCVVTDPPYGLGFMGKDWDSIAAERSRPESADETDRRFNNAYPRTGKGPAAVAFDGVAFERWCESWAVECLRVLRPGGHLLAFGGTRTAHRLTCGIEDAGFEIRDAIGSGSGQLAWVYGSGFPKSLDVGKAIDKAAGAEREAIGPPSRHGGGTNAVYAQDDWTRANQATMGADTAPATDAARQWDGWGTALKPAWEPIVVARKPLAAGTVAANVLRFGTGALNIDACRIGTESRWNTPVGDLTSIGSTRSRQDGEGTTVAGRWPANVVLDGRAAASLDTQSGDRPGMARGELRRGATTGRSIGGESAYGTAAPQTAEAGYDDSGGASRFFHVAEDDPLPIDTLSDRFRYVAKADTSERPRVPKAGASGAWQAKGINKRCGKCGKSRHNVGASACACPDPDFQPDPTGSGHVSHPTVKPLDLMRWLVRLVTPPGGVCLDPFAGSGATVEACILEGFRCIAIEREADYLPLIEARVTRRRDPVRNLELTGGDLGLFGLEETT